MFKLSKPRLTLAVTRRRRRHLRSVNSRPCAVHKFRLDFSLPYRTRLGQRLNLVGSGLFGEWNLKKAVPMKWRDGDLWNGEINTAIHPGEKLQYKYVVCNAEGDIDAWMPGENLQLEIPSDGEGREIIGVHVMDTWDGAVHEVIVKSKAIPDERVAETETSKDDCGYFLRKSYEDLELKLNAAQTLREATKDDAGTMELVLADRELALAANKASALAKVAEITEQGIDLDQWKYDI